jgi:hypothetical protein
MPVYWTNDDPALPLPDWLQAAVEPEFHTHMAQIILLLRPLGLKRLRAKLAKATNQILLVPRHGGWHAMRITTEPDIIAKPGGWLRVCFDVIFEKSAANIMDIASKAISHRDDINGIGPDQSSNRALAPPARARAA